MTENNDMKWFERDPLPRAVIYQDGELELITPEQLSEFTQVSLKTLANWRWAGVGPEFVKLSARVVRYRRSDVLAWLKESSRKGGRGDKG